MLSKFCHGGMSRHLWRQAFSSLASSFLSLSTGLNTGLTAVMLPQLEEDVTFPYDKKYESWIASITTLSMILGCFCTGPCLDYFGRKASHTILNTPFIVGWLFIAFATNNTMILIGRFLTGISAGASRPVNLVYIGELSDPKYRSIYLLIPSLMTHAGVILIHVIGKYLYWKTSCLVSLIPSVVSAVFYLFLEDSPLWLISKGSVDGGRNAFKWFRGESDEANIELENFLDKQKDKAYEHYGNMKDLLYNRSLLKPFLIVFVVMLCTQSSGSNVLMFYSEDVFNNTFSGKVDGYIMMMVTDVTRAVASLTVCIFAKVLPKKKTFLSCSFGITGSLGCLLIIIFLNPEGLKWISIVLITLFFIFSGVVISIGWSFIPEILPNNVRGIGSAISTAVGYVVLFIAVKILPDVLDKYGEPAMYAGFAISTFIPAVVLCFILPETKDKTLQSIEDDYTERNCNTKL